MNFTLEDNAIENWSRDADFELSENLRDDSYTDLDALPQLLEGLQNDSPDHVKLEVIGQGTLDEPLYMMKLTNQVAEDMEEEKVHVVLIGGLRGEEPIGGEMLIRFIMHMVTGKIQC